MTISYSDMCVQGKYVPIKFHQISLLHLKLSLKAITKTLDKALKQLNDIVIETKNELKKSFSEVLEQKSMDNVMDVSAVCPIYQYS